MFLKTPFYNPQITIKDLIGSFLLRNPRKELESRLQGYFNSEDILLLKSARQGIKLILESLNLTEEDEVIVPSFICSVVPEAVIKAGAKPVFCDIEEDGFNMDIESAKKLISPRTRAIILAHIFGTPAPIDKFVKLSKDNKIVLIEDCAQAFGAKYKGKLLGTLGDFAVFSFGISKNLGGLGGGFLYSQDKESFQKIKRNVFETNKKPFSFKKYFEFFLIPLVFNKYFYWLFDNFVEKYAVTRRDKEKNKEFLSTLSILEIKVALQKLRRYEKSRKRRNENAFIYQQELKDFFSYPRIAVDGCPAYPYLPIFASQEIFDILDARNIPVRKMKFWELHGDKRLKYFLLPLDYSSKEVKIIAQQIKEILANISEGYGV